MEQKRQHGGKRPGAGRPKGQGRYGESTAHLRVPASMVDNIKQYAATRGFRLPLYTSRVQAGLPSAADDHIDENIDLSAYLISNPADTFLVRATGESMIDAGIRDGDLLVVDKKAAAGHGKIVVAAVDGYPTVKYLHIRKDGTYLAPANPNFSDIPVNPETGIVIMGVVTKSIQSH